MRLALGTAQFGLDYGVSNRSGQVALSEIEDILLEAKNHNINTIDTAIILGILGDLEYDIGNFDIAVKTFNKELSLFKEQEDNQGIAIAEGHLGMVLLQKGN